MLPSQRHMLFAEESSWVHSFSLPSLTSMLQWSEFGVYHALFAALLSVYSCVDGTLGSAA